MLLIPSFVKVGHLLQKMKWGDARARTHIFTFTLTHTHIRAWQDGDSEDCGPS